MDSSVLLARLLGPLVILIGTGVLLGAKRLPKMGEDFAKNRALIFISGIFIFGGGLAIVLFHNIWVVDWRLIITIFGWLTLAKGVFMVTLPVSSAKIAQVYLKKVNLVIIIWLIMFVPGILLTLKGYSFFCR